jgi:hypothetical protein
MAESIESARTLAPAWNPMLDALIKLIDLVEWHGSVDIQTQMARFDNHPLTSPLVTLIHEPDASLSVEISGNSELLPKLTEVEYETMVLLGWQKPRAGKDEDYGDYPYFTKNFEANTEPLEIADAVLYAIVFVYGMKQTDLINMDDIAIADWLDDWEILHRLEIEPSNDERLLFRLETLEDRY